LTKRDTATHEEYLQLHRWMCMAKALDERTHILVKQGRAPFVGSSRGHEGIQVASTAAIGPDDWLVPHYRALANAIVRGLTLGDRGDLEAAVAVTAARDAYRTKEEIADAAEHDPIARFRTWLVERGWIATEDADRLRAECDQETVTRRLIERADRTQAPSFTATRALTRRALDSGLLPSMGSVGDCFDNAVMESFWSRVQVELLDRKRWRTRLEMANAIFDYLEIFHNRQRRHSSLGMLTPVEFEARRQPTTAA